MNNTLKHVAIIMDGNGRWATNRGFKRSRGHKEGAKNLEKLALYANKIGIEVSRYNIDGKIEQTPYGGINIIKTNEGIVRKILVK